MRARADDYRASCCCRHPLATRDPQFVLLRDIATIVYLPRQDLRCIAASMVVRSLVR
jgi:hypothetical protein